MTQKELKMSFDPQTIEHLGVKMYSNIPNAMAELVANAYDADAKEVQIKLTDKGQTKIIQVVDNGNGMSFDEINENFLRIGRNRRKSENGTSPGRRKVTGRKGLGKLALFGIGNHIEIVTIKKDSKEKTRFVLDWDELTASTGGDYKPKYETEQCEAELHSTTITLSKLNRKSAFEPDDLAISLSKLFNLFDKTFKCSVQLNDDEPLEVNNELRYKNIGRQFGWSFPKFLKKISCDYKHKNKICGKIISTKKPLKPGMRGITLFANGRLANAPEFFGVSESGHGFSYFTGWLNVDFLDDLKEDIISTNRQSLNWDDPVAEGLRNLLKQTLKRIDQDWQKKRSKKRKENIKKASDVNIEGWYKNLPQDVLSQVEPIVDVIIEDSEQSSEKATNALQQLNRLVPEYPYYHWRHMHQKVQDASQQYYQKKDYYNAFFQAAIKYANTVREHSGSFDGDDHPMMGDVFGARNGQPKLLSVTKKYKKPNGKDFNQRTIENIENGQRELSQGIITGCRNILAHEEHEQLKKSNLFNEKDCLDALSLLSHLFRRLDDAVG